MHPRRDSTARSRQFGDELRAKRKAADLRATRLAAMLGWSPAKINKLESGERGTSDVDVAVYLNSCGVVGDELHRLLALNRETSRGAWLDVMGLRPPNSPSRFIHEEARAVAITGYCSRFVPGLLQSHGYMEHVVRSGVEHRLRRQQLLRRSDRPDITFFVDEQVLRRPVGGPAVMHDQLMALLFTPAVVRIVPVGEVVHSGLAHGDFVLREYAEDRPVVYGEAWWASVYLEDAVVVEACVEAIGELAECALDVEDSRAFVSALADEYGASCASGDQARTRASSGTSLSTRS
ncbi:helix-turn-helix domain-containing protein [Umezawaea beigongshangensis]|uniref:helix-turn-helix domain-containing protein n=1 Tax=Umezawaea beigongshangensis TaxID=2780383 RepID=UPI0018F10A25|nr:helix-turn-helix transcriptional regulator [Umezawaea beigongshangensis]